MYVADATVSAFEAACLPDREPHYRLLFEQASDAIFLGTPDGVIVAANPAACRLLGMREDELRGMTGLEFCAPEWLSSLERRIAAKAAGHEEDSRYEMVALNSSGVRIPVEVCSSVVRDGDRIVGIQAIVRDLRDRRRAERALRESEERFRGAFEAAPAGLSFGSLDGRWLKANEALCTLLGYTQDELLERRFQDLTHPDDLEDELALSERLLAGEIASYQLDKRFVRKDGAPARARVSVFLVRGEDGVPAYSVGQYLPLGAEAEPPAPCPLSPRERRVLAILAEGHTSAEVAAELGIGGETVQTHVRRAMHKLDARTRTQAVARALACGWLEAPRPPTTR